jgi:RNA polymerase sigma-70 factor (ECF subfamily)
LAIIPATRRAPAAAVGGESELDLLKERNGNAWTAVFEREHPMVFRAVLAQVGNRQAAEDITAQVFLEAMEGIGRYRDRGRPFTAWLLTIARHRALDWHRRRRREDGTEQPEPVADGPDAGLGAALEALAQLTSEQREVVHLRFVEGYPIDDVARLVGRSPGAVKAMQHRAIERLRTILQATPGDES